MLPFIVTLYDMESGTGRAIQKEFEWPIIPREGETLHFDLPDACVSVEVTRIWHNFGDLPYIDVQCENVHIEYLRRLYQRGTGWELHHTTEKRFLRDE